jgi:hypothetical protein
MEKDILSLGLSKPCKENVLASVRMRRITFVNSATKLISVHFPMLGESCVVSPVRERTAGKPFAMKQVRVFLLVFLAERHITLLYMSVQLRRTPYGEKVQKGPRSFLASWVEIRINCDLTRTRAREPLIRSPSPQ